MDVLITLVSTEKASKSKGFTQLRQSSSVTYKRKRRSIMKRKPTAEEITTLFNATPELFFALLGRESVSGCTVILPGREPIEIRKENQK